ncbi:carbohydrate-binding protein [Candidatus Symbiothrix dinenymphae]|uniref:carbohydrate-binding protein n=1 Tax=Candidatus Symbiothrix dinenymphae TaxID=467085 RepID=UPI0006C30CB5|nr:carbohydrate-binding protein [Candidatus Symbiothrix dinenymphae]GAP72991.1 hypothetical protein SAMD00024442_53_5 [Candidatus Symbiothrix dinenymphae]
MKKYVFLIGMVALMSSCNGDIYDNIKEFVDSETVYPAGYDQTKIYLLSGYDRVEIYLMGDTVKDKLKDNPHLAKAIKTVVKWGEGPNEKMEFTPARAWVDVTGLTVPQVYHFQVYTEDEFGNISTPVTIGGKPFTEADKALLVFGVSSSANASQAIITPTPDPASYTVAGGEYSVNVDGTVRSGSVTDRIVLLNLSAGTTYTVHFTLNLSLFPLGVVDTLSMAYDLDVTTMTTADLNAYINSTTPFPPTADGLIGNQYYVNSSTPCIISGGAYDFGGADLGVRWGQNNSNILGGKNSQNYRSAGGETGGPHWGGWGGIDYNSIDDETTGLVAVGWMQIGNWWAYTVDVVDPGVYKIEYNRATTNNGCRVTLTLDNLDVLGVITLTNNGSWSGSQHRNSVGCGKT